MKKLIFYFIILALAIALGLVIHQNPGYVLITFGHTQIQTTLWFAILSILIVIFVYHQFIRLLKGTYGIPTRYLHWLKKRHTAKRQHIFNKGLFLFLTDCWDQASSILLKLTKEKTPSLLYYMTLAKIAYHKKDYENRTYYLSKAKAIATPTETVTIDIVQARWQRETGEYEQALALLNKLKISNRHNPEILKELSYIYSAQGNWENLHKILSELRRYARLQPAAYEEIESRVFTSLLSEAVHSNNAEQIETIWKSIPRYLRHNSNFIYLYTSGLIQHNQNEKAEKILRKGLETQWNFQLIEQYTLIPSSDPAKQLSRAESWLKTHPNDPDLLFCLGQLCQRHRLWGKAKSYLESALKQKPGAEIYTVLGKVLEQLGEKPQALECYRKGLESNH